MRFRRLAVVMVAVGVSATLVAKQPSEEPAPAAMESTLYTKPYEATEHGAYPLPKGLEWKVMPRYVGITERGERIVDDRVTLILVDEEKGFWPVISKMSLEEAQDLHKKLGEVIAEKEEAEGAKDKKVDKAEKVEEENAAEEKVTEGE